MRRVKRAIKVGGVLLSGFVGTFTFLLFTGWIGIFIILIALTTVFWLTGWWWEKHIQRPILTSTPLVSILIPAWKSEKTIANTIKSVKALDYPKKEIIVVNDYPYDNTSKICRKLGVYVIENKKRLGKAQSLNIAVKKAKGEMIFFIDSDTFVQSDCLKLLVSWMEKKNIGAVVPRYKAYNSNKFLTKLIEMENCFYSKIFKMQMFFGSMISFRGCGVLIRRSLFEKMGGWPKTLTEDSYFAAKLVKSGYIIQYEPKATIETVEAETISDLKRQRTRWGIGAIHSFLEHKGFYCKNPSFLLYFLPYFFLFFAIAGMLFLQSIVYFFPLFIFPTLLYTFSVDKVLILFMAFFTFFLNTVSIPATSATLIQTVIMARIEDKKDIIYVLPYVFFYIPLVLIFYTKGMIKGMINRKNKVFDLSYW